MTSASNLILITGSSGRNRGTAARKLRKTRTATREQWKQSSHQAGRLIGNL